jgi:hypothetical protein
MVRVTLFPTAKSPFLALSQLDGISTEFYDDCINLKIKLQMFKFIVP